MHGLIGWLHAEVHLRLRMIRALLEGQRGQGTVEYVGLILLVSLLMVGMVAAMRGFRRALRQVAASRSAAPTRTGDCTVSATTRWASAAAAIRP